MDARCLIQYQQVCPTATGGALQSRPSFDGGAVAKLQARPTVRESAMRGPGLPVEPSRLRVGYLRLVLCRCQDEHFSTRLSESLVNGQHRRHRRLTGTPGTQQNLPGMV